MLNIRIEKNTAPKEPLSWLIVGLGNPGEEYRSTRHNAGFLTIDSLAEQLGLHIDRMKFHALTTEASIGSSRVLLMKPMTLMNASGIAVSEAAAFYKIPADHILVISDDINLAPGRMRLRKNGSAGGHNGLKSVIECLGSDKFPRIKLGVGQKPFPEYDIADWVLARIPKESEKTFVKVLDKIYDILSLMLKGETDKAMCDYNGISLS